LDAKVRVLALEKEWRADWSTRMDEAELRRRLGEVGPVAERESFVSRASVVWSFVDPPYEWWLDIT
jgi:hypothetical protein